MSNIRAAAAASQPSPKLCSKQSKQKQTIFLSQVVFRRVNRVWFSSKLLFPSFAFQTLSEGRFFWLVVACCHIYQSIIIQSQQLRTTATASPRLAPSAASALQHRLFFAVY